MVLIPALAYAPQPLKMKLDKLRYGCPRAAVTRVRHHRNDLISGIAIVGSYLDQRAGVAGPRADGAAIV
jgi:hypothetical protein